MVSGEAPATKISQLPRPNTLSPISGDQRGCLSLNPGDCTSLRGPHALFSHGIAPKSVRNENGGVRGSRLPPFLTLSRLLHHPNARGVPLSLKLLSFLAKSLHPKEVLGFDDVVEMQEDGQRGEEEKGKAVAAAEEEAAVAVLPHDLVASEVLTRLPAKYLMRFKCVSKLWGSTISKDPAFSKAHRARRQRSGSSSLFITCSDADSFSCFYATRNDSHPSYCEEEEESSLVVSKPHQFTTSCKYEGATEVINGLFCLHAGNRAWICNVSTHEIRELPYSSDLENAQKFKYFFGCASTDNNRKEFKLLKLCLIPLFSKVTNLIRTYIRVCEILTMGKDRTWRRPWTLVDNPEIELELDRTSVYIDGSLCCWHCNGGDLIVFNFEDESLQQLRLPPKASYSSNAEYGSLLLQFRGHFALLRQKEELIGRGVQHGCLEHLQS